MKSSRYLLLATVISFLIPIAAYAQSQLAGFGSNGLEFNTPGGGARAAGMGGAGLALAEGEMAYSWNPGAMIYTDKTKFGIDVLSSGNKQSGLWINNRYWDTRNPNIEPFEIDFSHTSINYGGFAAPFSLDSDSDARFLLVPVLPLAIIPMLFSPSEELQLTIGGGYRHIFDMEAKYDLPGFDNSKNTFEQNRGLDAITLGIAAKISEGIGFGWNMNAYVRGTESNEISGESYNLRDWFYDNRPDSIVAERLKLKSTFTGFNMDFGLAGDFGMFKGGAVLHTPYNLTQEVLRTWQLIALGVEPDGFIDRVTYTYKMPMGASFGVAFTPIENFALAFDYDYRPLSKVEIKTDWEQLEDSQNDTTLSAGWEDVNQFRIGAEYSIDAGFATIPLRVGMRNEPLVGQEVTDHSRSVAVYSSDPPDFESDYTYGDQITTNIITFGTGLAFDKVWFDIGYQYGSSSYNVDIEYFHTDVSTDPDAATETLYSETHEIKYDYSKLFFSVGMYF